MALRIWHLNNFSHEPFERTVSSVIEAETYLEILAAYDLYQGSRIAFNVQGVQCFHNGEWEDRERDYDLDGVTTWICQEDPATCD